MKPVRTDEITGLWTYLSKIDFTEPWFLGLASFHVTCVVATYLSRKHLTVQGVIFACFLVLVGLSEYINEFAAEHARHFARQQYFDSNGLFISVVFSVPILVNCMVIVIFWLNTSASLMGGIKRKQMLLQQRQAAKSEVKGNEVKGSEVKGNEVKGSDVKDSEVKDQNADTPDSTQSPDGHEKLD